MPNFTKNAIKQAFIKLLEEKPYNEITIKDIVGECGINRNSFYYHFQDLPALLEEIIRESVDGIIKKYPSFSSLEECILVAVEFAESNKRAILHIYRSVDRDKVMSDVSKNYRNFSGLADDMDGKVKFIYRTDGIE